MRPAVPHLPAPLLRGLLSGLLLLGACESTVQDTTNPEVRWVYPADGDTFDPGIYTVSVVATDNVEMRWVTFWVEKELLGIVRHPHGDTYSLGVDCRSDTHAVYPLVANAEDKAGYNAFALITVHIRR